MIEMSRGVSHYGTSQRFLKTVTLTFLAPGTSVMEDNFFTDQGCWGWFGDDSRVLHLFCILFLI